MFLGLKPKKVILHFGPLHQPLLSDLGNFFVLVGILFQSGGRFFNRFQNLKFEAGNQFVKSPLSSSQLRRLKLI
jgi:hypothetical protein